MPKLSLKERNRHHQTHALAELEEKGHSRLPFPDTAVLEAVTA